MPFELSTELIADLRRDRAERAWSDEVMDREDAFLLSLGLGPAYYLTSDGRVLVDPSSWDGGPLSEATGDEAFAALVVGAKNTGVDRLLALVPSRPAGARVCARCEGRRWMTFGTEVGTGKPGQIVCGDCSGKGWTG